ncbi:MAG: ArsR/SmtB family transcription factor [Chitinophagaceae bacterium]
MSIEARRDVFQAIADPTRRQIIDLVAIQSMNLNSIAQNFDISRPAISQQIRILTDCGLIIVKQQGRERICETKLETLSEVSAWVEQNKKLWEARLDKLGFVLTALKKDKNPKTKKRIKTNKKWKKL